MKALIDTCVIIDALQHREPFCEDAEKIFLLSASKAFDGYITAKSTADIYYLTHKSTHCDETSRQILGKLFTLFYPLDTEGRACISALSSEMTDYEDAIMDETAELNKIDCIVTRNIKDYTKSKVSCITPHEFIAMLEG